MTKTLADLSEKMRGIDFCMLNTHGLEGAITARPMTTIAKSVLRATPSSSRARMH